MVGSNNLNTCGMSSVDDFLNNIIACENLNVNEIYISGLSCFDVEFCISIRLDCFFSTFFGSTESHEKWDVTKNCTKVFQYIFNLCKIKNTFKPVYTPLNNINRDRIKSFCFFNDVFFCDANDRNDDLRCACTNLNVTDFNCIHDEFPFYYIMITTGSKSRCLIVQARTDIGLFAPGSHFSSQLLRVQPFFCNGCLQTDQVQHQLL